MNKVVTIHLNGIAHQLEEAGYETLRAYLDKAAQRLAGNPDLEEIVADIEQSISDKFRSLTGAHRNVVLTREVENVLAAMGPVDDGSTQSDPERGAPSPAASASSGAGTSSPPPPKRLYRIYEGAMISGVCNGLGAYFGIDPTVIRVACVILAFITVGGAAAVYLVLALLLPQASTERERAAAHGIPSTTQEFINRARAGYYEAARQFGDRAARREWKRKFRHEMRRWRHGFTARMHAQPWGHWQPMPVAPAGVWFATSLLSVLTVGLTLVWLFALLSLLLKGSVLGHTPPAGIPLWVALLLLCVAYQCIVSPLRISRHALYRSGCGVPVCSPRGGGLAETVGGLVLLAFALWAVDRYVPHAHEFFVQIPPAFDRFTTELRAWWARQ